MALLNRGQAAMEGGFRTALARLPFALVELHPDNGREFFNDHLKRLFPQLVPGLTLSRSRPYHKNDNRFVEQKNDALVRQYVGYARFDTPEQVAALYADMSVYYNLFQPVLHLVEKTVVSDPTADESPGGAIPTLTPTRIRRRWDRDQTPCERLVATGTLLPTQQQCLQALYSQTNALALRHRLPPTLRRLVNGKE